MVEIGLGHLVSSFYYFQSGEQTKTWLEVSLHSWLRMLHMYLYKTIFMVRNLCSRKNSQEIKFHKKEFDHGGDLSHMEKRLICTAVVLH